ncbi:MAG: protein kinase, partial [Proteobacteria bacterium]|nr:protein kinase [Pseudomonadota bacterium]
MAVRDALTGRVLGEFVLRERIGEGGFGAVYRCEQPLLGREAVIKVLHNRLRNSEVVLQRFIREAQLASRLDHPYAAHIYAFGVEKDDGMCWIAMELVQGTALDHWIRDHGPLPIGQLVPFFERVAEVVQTAHEAGIVHRDLKPSNIMVIERAGRLLPKLLDFGIAKVFDSKAQLRPRTRPIPVPVVGDGATGLDVTAPSSDELSGSSDTVAPPVAHLKPSEIPTLPGGEAAVVSHEVIDERLPSEPLTQANATMGSPPYMSPEQWGDATNVGPRSDLYALGIVAYEALLGRRPFIGTTITAFAQMHCFEPVPPVGDGVSPTFDRFFARALAKDPADRPATALELAAILRVAAGIGIAPEDLPRLDEAIRDAWLAEAPQNLAEGVATLDGARNLHQARDAARDLFRGLLRYLITLALAARAQVRGDRDDPTVRELLRALRQRELDEDERVKLLRTLVRPFADRRGVYPVPELVDLVGRSGDRGDLFDAVVALRPLSDVGAEDVVRSQLVQLLPALAKLLRAASFVLDYAVVVPHDGSPERWMGMRRARRTIAFVRGELVADQAVLLDREGRQVLVLWPLVQMVAPTAGTERESFVLDGRGRLGARLAAAPTGFEHHDPAVWDWFAEHVLGEVEGEVDKREDDRPPYLGLASFVASDADRFVGREREIDTFINRLRRQPLQVVVGPSGAGKSSFVHAGVVPGLPVGWRTISVRPGMTPVTALAQRLMAAAVSTTDLHPLLATAPAAAAALIAQAAGDGAIVIVVDQLEELFTLCSSPDERERFASVLAHLAASADGSTRVICTVRDDFLMHVESLGPLRAVLSSALFLIGNPSRDDLVRTIVEPARRVGYEISDPELAGEMVDVVADRPGALALLSFTASRLWELRDRRFHQLTRKAYEGMGGVAGALGQHAETTFLSLVTDEQRVAREAFRHLVTTDKTRAVLFQDELRQRLASPRSDAVIAKLVEARLLAVIEGETRSQIEIIHEALIGAWPRLQQWTREDTEDSRSHEQIRAAAKQWVDRNRPRELLWRGDLLRELARWRRHVTLTDLEAAFADASQADGRRGSRIRRAIVGFAIVVTAVFVAMLARANAHAHAAQGEAEALLRDSTFDQGRLRMLQGDKLGALPFLAKAYKMGEIGAANRLMIEEAVRPTRARVAALDGHTDKLWQVAYSPDGKRLATASLDGTARIWDASSGAQLAVVKLDGAALAIAFSPDGGQLAVGGRGSSIRIWDVVQGRERAKVPIPVRVTHVEFSP